MLYRPRLGTDFKDSLSHSVEVKTIKELENVVYNGRTDLSLHFTDTEGDDIWCRYIVSVIDPHYQYPCACGYLNDDFKKLLQ